MSPTERMCHWVKVIERVGGIRELHTRLQQTPEIITAILRGNKTADIFPVLFFWSY